MAKEKKEKKGAKEEITDLTQDEEDVEKENGKQKKSKKKESKPPGDKKEAKQSKKEKAGKKKFGLIKLILLLAPIVLVAAFVAALILNLFGFRDMIGDVVIDPILSVVVWFDPEFRAMDEDLRGKSDEREAELDEREGELEKREESMTVRETENEAHENALDSREDQLNKRSVALDEKEKQLEVSYDATVPLYRREMTEQERADMQSLSRLYSQMPPEVAATVLQELDEDHHVAAILYHMSERNAAAILTIMDPEYVARITEIRLFS